MIFVSIDLKVMAKRILMSVLTGNFRFVFPSIPGGHALLKHCLQSQANKDMVSKSSHEVQKRAETDGIEPTWRCTWNRSRCGECRPTKPPAYVPSKTSAVSSHGIPRYVALMSKRALSRQL